MTPYDVDPLYFEEPEEPPRSGYVILYLAIAIALGLLALVIAHPWGR